MQQGLVCNNMGQQPGHGQLPYGHAGLDPSLAASMANLGLQGSLMDSLQGSHWQVGATTSANALFYLTRRRARQDSNLSAVRALQQVLLQWRAPVSVWEPCAASCSSPKRVPACH